MPVAFARLQLITSLRVSGRKRLRRVPPGRHPMAVELSFAQYLRSIVDTTEARVRTSLFPIGPRLVKEARQKTDAADDEARGVLDVVRVSVDRGVVADGRLETNIRTFGNRIGIYQRSELQRQIRAGLGVEVPINDPGQGARLRSFTTENVRLIKSIPAQALDQVERLVISGVQAGTRWEDLSKDIADRFDVARSRADLIARDQVGKFYGATTRARQTELGLTQYVWDATPDSRTRPEHRARDGQTYEWSDPPEDGHPGQPINCRCTATPDFSTLIDGE